MQLSDFTNQFDEWCAQPTWRRRIQFLFGSSLYSLYFATGSFNNGYPIWHGRNASAVFGMQLGAAIFGYVLSKPTPPATHATYDSNTVFNVQRAVCAGSISADAYVAYRAFVAKDLPAAMFRRKQVYFFPVVHTLGMSMFILNLV